MTKHYNTSITEDANRIFNTKGNDNLLNDVNPIIQPVVVVERYANVVSSANSAVTGAFNLYTVPSDKDFYLTGICTSMVKNAACDVATSRTCSVQALVNGVSQTFIGTSVITLTAERSDQVVQFNPPVKLDRNQTVTVSGAFTAGVYVRCATLIGYTVETTKGV